LGPGGDAEAELRSQRARAGRRRRGGRATVARGSPSPPIAGLSGREGGGGDTARAGEGDDPPLRRRLPASGRREPASDQVPDGEVPGHLSQPQPRVDHVDVPTAPRREELRRLHRLYAETGDRRERAEIREQL